MRHEAVMDTADPGIFGEYGVGAYGPTIMLKVASRGSAEWLWRVISDLAAGIRGEFDLAKEPQVRIVGIRSLMLRSIGRSSEITLRGPGAPVPDADFEWELDTAGWRRTAGLLEPFVQGKTGHQYLTQEGVDAALVVVSFGESDVRVPV
jgi:hypothetical protein